MKLVFDAEEVIYAVLDSCEAVEAICKDYKQADAWLGGEAWGIEDMVCEFVKSEDFDQDDPTFYEHAYFEEGEGVEWEYKGKRADKIDAFLPQLQRDLFNELDDSEWKQVPVCIDKATLDEARHALHLGELEGYIVAGLKTDDDPSNDDASNLRVIVDSLSTKGWEDVVEANKDNIIRQIKNLQYRKKIENEARIDENRLVRRTGAAEKEKSENRIQNPIFVYDAKKVLSAVLKDDDTLDVLSEDYTQGKKWLKREAESREQYVEACRDILGDDAIVPYDESRLSKYDARRDEGEADVWEYGDQCSEDFDEFLPQLERDLFNVLDDEKHKQISVRIKETTLGDALYALPLPSQYEGPYISDDEALHVIVESIDDWGELVKEHKDDINRQIKNLQYREKVENEARIDENRPAEKENSIDNDQKEILNNSPRR
ncbi:MAG: hypothetical protein PUA61_06745 [Succinatimonas hippei]|nr:hypothetical protein [Succinatimonas hippei]